MVGLAATLRPEEPAALARGAIVLQAQGRRAVEIAILRFARDRLCFAPRDDKALPRSVKGAKSAKGKDRLKG